MDSLTVLVTGDGVSKILAIPKVPDKKAEPTAKAILEIVESWDL